MSLREYLNFYKWKTIKSGEKDNENNSLSTIDVFEDRFDKIELLSKEIEILNIISRLNFNLENLFKVNLLVY